VWVEGQLSDVEGSGYWAVNGTADVTSFIHEGYLCRTFVISIYNSLLTEINNMIIHKKSIPNSKGLINCGDIKNI